MVKEKPDQTRIYDEDGFRQRAACLCFKNESETEVLLVTSSRHPDRWIIPGGGVEPEESNSMAAVREVIEEAGVMGKIDRFLGLFEERRGEERRDRTAVFVLIVTEELAEWDDKKIGRRRKWFRIEEAQEQLKPIHLKYFEQHRQQKQNAAGASGDKSVSGTSNGTACTGTEVPLPPEPTPPTT